MIHIQTVTEITTFITKQNYEQDVEYTDANMFLFSLVPLRLTFGKTDDTNDILWKNLTPSSTCYCRPIKFFYKKETKNNTCKEVKAIENEIIALVTIEIVLDNISVPVH